MEFIHKPVLLKEVLSGLKLCPGGIYIDATVGGGGHARAILDGIQPGGTLVGIDQDQEALDAAQQHLRGLAPGFIPVRESFANLKAVVSGLGIDAVHGILFDLGVSSYQLDNPDRGFTYMLDAPLDMRMDRGQAVSARDLVNTLSAKDLAEIIRKYGEERWAGRIAKFIVTARETSGAVETTGQLVEVIKNAVPARARRTGGHPARRTFQALRIAVNRELEILTPALMAAADLLVPGGRLAVITFHSLEDRLVKKAFVSLAGGCSCPPDMPVCGCGGLGAMEIVTRRAIAPGEEEIRNNNRARSAKLRIAERRQVLKKRAGE